jgi:hypothetical protein
MSETNVTITKLGDDSVKSPTVVETRKPIAIAGVRKTLKTYPRSILKKIQGVRDPAKAPPMKKGMKKHTLKLLTEKGARKHRKTLKQKISKMSDSKVKDIVQKAGLLRNPEVPASIARQILDSAAGAGFVSV